MEPSFLAGLISGAEKLQLNNLDATGQFQNCSLRTNELQQKTGGMATWGGKKHAAIGLNGCVLFYWTSLKTISYRRRELLSQQTRVPRAKPLQQKAAPLLVQAPCLTEHFEI
jgi:hypothetical protein